MVKINLYNKKYYGRESGDIAYNWVISLISQIILNAFKKNFIKKSLILEVGCGDGNISRWLSARGFEVEAIDISEEAIKMAKRQKSGVNYICGDVFSLKRNNYYYDVVFSLHVMEHVENVEDTLKEIYRILKKGGKLLIRIPNSDSLEAKLAGKSWFHWDEPYHKHHWTSGEFKKILTKIGFRRVVVNFKMWEYKQVLLYSVLNYLGVKKINKKQKLLLLPLQLVFIPMSVILGFLFKNSGTVELVAKK